VVGRPDGAPDEAELSRHAAAHLPPYAVPERIALLAELPRTSTDKVDRIRLQTLAMAAREGLAQT